MPGRLIASAFVRSSDPDDRQGGVYLLDLRRRPAAVAVGAATAGIDWRGRGLERGFRGIACDGDGVFLAAGDELFAFTPGLKPAGSWRNYWLGECRDICVHQRTLFLVSSTYDAILGFDLDRHEFHWGMHVGVDQFRFKGSHFDPLGSDGPLPLNKLQLSDIYCNSNGMYLSGRHTGGMLHFNGEQILMSAQLPRGARNARPFRRGVLFIDNQAHELRYCGRDGGQEDRALPLPSCEHPDGTSESACGDTAPEPTARGLCLLNDRVAAVGSAPATVTLFDLEDNRRLLSVALSRNPFSAIHSLASWPFT
jgi:hypothetical protein